jgi:ribonuclease HI
MVDEVLLYTDAASRGIPGRTATAIVVFGVNDELLLEEAFRVGNTTNSRAEYLALLRGLALCTELTAGRSSAFRTASSLSGN